MGKKEEVKHPKRMVEAVELGHCGKKLRRPGDKFEFAGAPADWFKEPGGKVAAEKPADDDAVEEKAVKAPAAKKAGKKS